MSYHQWTAEETHLLKLLRKNKDFEKISTEIAKRYTNQIPGFPTPRTPDAVRRKCEREEITIESCANYTSESNPIVSRWEDIKKIQDQYKEQSVLRKRGIIHPKEIAREIVSFSDIHVPLARMDLLESVAKHHANTADICVLNGDIMDGYAFSTFEKNKRISMLHEYRCAMNLLMMLSEMFPAVILIKGNHDVRSERTMKSAGFTKEQTQILRPDLMARLANGEVLDETGMLVDKINFKNVHYEASEPWYTRIGKTIFAHPYGRGGSAPGAMVNKCNQFFSRRYTENEYDSIVIGHTHKIYKGIVNSKLLVEQGCFAGLMDYAFSPKMQYTASNGMNGYAVVYQDKEGNTDFNSSGPVFLGEVQPPKKDILL